MEENGDYERDVNVQWYRFLLTGLTNSSQCFVLRRGRVCMHLLINESRTDALYLHSSARFCLNVLYKRSLQVYNVSKKE